MALVLTLLFLFFGFLLGTWLSWCSCHRYDGCLCTEPGEAETCLKLLCLLSYHAGSLSLGEHVHLVHGDHQLVHQDLSQYNALGCLGLNEFLRIDHKHHDVND